MSALKFLGTFLQGTLFGGTYDDLAFEVRVLKGEIARLHERIDKELLEVRDRIDKLEGKPGVGKGRARLSVMSAAAVADAGPSTGTGGIKASSASPGEPNPPAPRPTASSAASTSTATAVETRSFRKDMNLRDAWLLHPDAPRVFARHHLPGCVDCAMSAIETVDAGATGHGLDVDRLVADLNQLASS